jgi:hypothetical protein
MLAEEPSMADSPHAETTAGATAVAEPPSPPDAPPTTATSASPAPKRRRWLGWTIGIVSAVIVIGALAGVVVWATRGRAAAPSDFSAYRAGFESAMAKTGTKAVFPAAPVELSGVSATGSHPFQTTFTADEITALVNVFPWTTDIQGTSVAVSGVSVGFPSAGTGSLKARVKVNGSSYSGSLVGPLEYRAGTITSTGATKVVAEGFTVTGDRATQATDMLLVYLNAYLKAAPGLSVDKAVITGDGVVVSGTAPDSLTLP